MNWHSKRLAQLSGQKIKEPMHCPEQRLALLEGIACGDRAIDEGRVVSHAQAEKRLARWLK